MTIILIYFVVCYEVDLALPFETIINNVSLDCNNYVNATHTSVRATD